MCGRVALTAPFPETKLTAHSQHDTPPRIEEPAKVMGLTVARQSVTAVLLAVFAPLAATTCGPGAQAADAAGDLSAIPATGQSAPVVPGIEVLLADSIHLLEGRRVGLVTNHTGIDRGAGVVDRQTS